MAKRKDKTTINKDQKAAKKFEDNLPEIAIKYNIRVSNPYGYYPEDVDKVLLNLEASINQLTKENKELKDKLYETETSLSKINSEFQKMKMEVSLMDFPDSSTETDFYTLRSGMENITGVTDPSVLEQNVLDAVPKSNIKPVTANHNQQPATYSNLVTPKRDQSQQQSSNTKKKLKL
jgi:DivIVA protein.